MYQRELEVAARAVTDAARLCEGVRRGADSGTLHKGDLSPVTVADFGSQALVCRALADFFPHDPVIGEESAAALLSAPGAGTREKVFAHVRAAVGEAGEDEMLAWIDRGSHATYAPRFWTLDPIDGTKGFLRGDQYAVALALVVEGMPVAACLACPNLPGPGGSRGVLLLAERGRGVTCQPLFGSEEGQPVRVSGVGRGDEARFCESFDAGHSSHDDSARVAAMLGISLPPVRMDSQAKYAVVARGEAELYLRLPTRKGYREKIWDHAAGSLVVEAAGGRVTDVVGNPLDFSRGATLERNRGVVVTNGLLHETVLEALRTVGVAAD